MFDKVLGTEARALVPLVNRKGRRTYRYVDDMATTEDPYIMEFNPTMREDIPWLHKGPTRMGDTGINQRKERVARYYHNMPELVDSDEDDWRGNPKVPVGRGPGGRKRGGRGRKPKRFQARDSCNPRRDHGPRKDDDDENPPEARQMGRNLRCHSNVFIRQNVNVK